MFTHRKANKRGSYSVQVVRKIYGFYKEMGRIPKTIGINLSVDKMFDIAKTMSTITMRHADGTPPLPPNHAACPGATAPTAPASELNPFWVSHCRSQEIVIFSAVTSEEDVLNAYKEGIDIFITKPTSLKLLRMQVDRLFEKTEGHNIKEPQGGVYNREEQKFLIKCRSIIDECKTDENFGIDMLAGRLAMSHSSLYKKIRRKTGMSLIEFINEYRIYKAFAMFSNGNTNVQKVAEACGFRDIKTFRETFKRKMNIPPKQFILKMNNTSVE